MVLTEQNTGVVTLWESQSTLAGREEIIDHYSEAQRCVVPDLNQVPTYQNARVHTTIYAAQTTRMSS